MFSFSFDVRTSSSSAAAILSNWLAIAPRGAGRVGERCGMDFSHGMEQHCCDEARRFEDLSVFSAAPCENGNLLSIEDCLCVYLVEENRRTLDSFAEAYISNGGERTSIMLTKTDYIRIVELYKDNGCIC